MTLEHIPLGDTSAFSSTFLDYIQQKESLTSFYDKFPTAEALISQAQEKHLSLEVRKILSDTLLEQYSTLNLSDKVSKNIKDLKGENTFTVTTGHQLNIFTGPLYFIYKIATVINTCKELSQMDPTRNYVPVYWMATEDHDFEEINHFNLFGKNYQWLSDQKGPVGRFGLEGMSELLSSLPEKVEIFEKAYTQSKNLADATRLFVNELFGAHGLIVVDGDHPQLKDIFKPLIEDEIFHQHSSREADATNQALEAAGYKTQIYPREINLFYLMDGLRERIELRDQKYFVLNTEISFTAESIRKEIQAHPERFSPNVVLRPLYQELILPNIAYVGGPAEVAYWLQLKGVFDHFKLVFPALMPRNFGLVINKANAKKMQKLGLRSKDLFLPLHDLKKKFLLENAEGELSLKEEMDVLEQVFESIKHKALQVDRSLEGFIGAESSKTLKSIDSIEKRLKKAEEKNQETAMNQIEQIKDKLFPGGGLQERKENFLNFYLNNTQFIEEILQHFSAFDYRFHVLIDHD